MSDWDRFDKSAIRAARVDQVVAIMRDLRWVRGKSHKMLAVEWGISEAASSAIAAEAYRRLCAEEGSTEQAKGAIVTHLAKALEDAQSKGPVAVAKVAEVYARIVGANAPAKHELRFDDRSTEELEAEAKQLAAEILGGKDGG